MTQTVAFGSLFSHSKVPSLNNSNQPFSQQSGWKLTKYGNKTLFKNLVNTKKVMGSPSAFGVVERLSYKGNEHMFVMKTIKYKTIGESAVFNTEIKVGQMKKIYRVGPRVIAYRELQKKGQYIMDNVEMGSSKARVFTLHDFKKIMKEHQYSNSTVYNIWKNILGTIKLFHKITKGQHGDLHGGNILIVMNGQNLSTKIIDYGAFRTNKELILRGRPLGKEHHGLNVYNVGVGQKFIYNANSIKNLLNKKNSLRFFSSPLRTKTSFSANRRNTF
jgi:hypothetical protein